MLGGPVAGYGECAVKKARHATGGMRQLMGALHNAGQIMGQK